MGASTAMVTLACFISSSCFISRSILRRRYGTAVNLRITASTTPIRIEITIFMYQLRCSGRFGRPWLSMKYDSTNSVKPMIKG